MTENDADAASARALEQARLRKERREAKIKAGGASRLNKITGLGGGVQRDPVPVPEATPSPAATPSPGPSSSTSPQAHADPDEVDISEHFYQPQRNNRTPQEPQMDEAQLRQMMLGFEGAGPGMGGMPGMGDMPGGDDPMMKMLQQMMMGGDPGGPGGMPNPFAAAGAGSDGTNPLAGMMPPGFPGAQQQAVIPDRYSAIWRLLHTAVALGLGLYIAIMTGFAGTKLERDGLGVKRALAVEDGSQTFDYTHFFWLFATAEAVLLSTRYFFDRAMGAPLGGGMISVVMGFLPQPYKGYVEIAMRYGRIFSTVRSDVMMCVFVLGITSWVRG